MEDPGYLPPNEKESRQYFTLEIAKPILLNSFFLSQGKPSLQDNIFSYIHLIKPAWKVDPTTRNDLSKYITDVAIKMKDKGLHKHMGSNIAARAEAIRVFDVMDKIFAGQYREGNIGTTHHDLMRLITTGMIDRDIYGFTNFGERGAMRYEHPEERRYTPLTDKYLSQFCYFILGENNLNIPEFDNMFEDIREYIQAPEVMAYLKQKFPDKLERTVELYNLHHPDKQVSLPDDNPPS